MNRLQDTFDQLPDPDGPRGADAVLAGARAQVQRRRARQRVLVGTGLAAAILLLAGLGVWATQGEGPQQVEVGPVVQPDSSATTATEDPTDTSSPATSSPDTSPPETEPEPTPPSQAAGTTAVEVYFSPGDGDCWSTEAVTRHVEGPAVLRGALEHLLAGPTPEEAERGLTSWFSAETAGALRSVAIEGTLARVDLADIRHLIGGASTSCGSAMLLQQLHRTVGQFPSVRGALFSFEGDVDAFYHWLQMDVPDLHPTWPGTVDVDHQTGTVTAPLFNPYVDDAGLRYTPSEMALLLLTGREQHDSVDVQVTERPLDASRTEVTVTLSNLQDDSVAAERYVLTFVTMPNGAVHFEAGTWSQRCQPGRGHQDFQVALCV